MLAKHHIRVPEDISLIGYDNYLYHHPLSERLTSYDVNMDKMACIAVGILKNRLDPKEKGRSIHYVDSDIIERNSVMDIRAKNNS